METIPSHLRPDVTGDSLHDLASQTYVQEMRRAGWPSICAMQELDLEGFLQRAEGFLKKTREPFLRRVEIGELVGAHPSPRSPLFMNAFLALLNRGLTVFIEDHEIRAGSGSFFTAQLVIHRKR